MATVRYFVTDVDEAARFYVDRLGFALKQQFGPAMAILERGDLKLWLAGPGASASRAMNSCAMTTTTRSSSRQRSTASSPMSKTHMHKRSSVDEEC